MGSAAVPHGDVGEFLGVLLRLEAGVALADGGLREALTRLECADVFGYCLALVHKLGIGADEADEFLAGHLRLARPLGRELGDEAHDVVVINDGGGEEHELEIKLFHGVVGAIARLVFASRLALLVFELLGRFQILAFDAAQCFRCGENIGHDDLTQQAGELCICQPDTVEGLEFLAKVLLQFGTVCDVLAVFVFQPLKLFDELILNVGFLGRVGGCRGRTVRAGVIHHRHYFTLGNL